MILPAGAGAPNGHGVGLPAGEEEDRGPSAPVFGSDELDEIWSIAMSLLNQTFDAEWELAAEPERAKEILTEFLENVGDAMQEILSVITLGDSDDDDEP